MIDFLTHIYRRGAEPFQSLSALSDAEALPIMKGLYVEGSAYWERFKDPQEYLHARRQTERWLRQAFVDKGGHPQQTYPNNSKPLFTRHCSVAASVSNKPSERLQTRKNFALKDAMGWEGL